jgi:hypothetical protein
MTFLHATLLIGGLAALIPIGLHMLGRRQPKAIVFPAIRFVRQTAIHAQRGWSIKRWLLLTLRVLMVLLLAFALASPRVQSGMFATYIMIGLIGILAILATAVALTSFGSGRSRQTTAIASLVALMLWGVGGTWLGNAVSTGQSAPLPSATGPICAAVVIDTSPAMGYRYHNMNRLDAAKEMATWLMDRLPIGSQIAIVNSDVGVRLTQDRVSANRLLDRTIVEGKAANLVQRISGSIDALRKSELERREIYVITDLYAPAWRDADLSDIPDKLARDESGKGIVGENVLLQLIDVSAPEGEVRNWSLDNFKLSQQTATPGSQVSISAELQSIAGSGTEQMTVELVAETVDRSSQTRDGKLVLPSSRVVDRQLLEVTDGGLVPFKLTLKDLSEGTNHAEVRISRPDPLDTDNIVYLSIEARSQGQTLVVADNKTEGLLACFAIDPDAQTESVDSNFKEPGAKSLTGETQATQPREPLYRLETFSQLDASDLSRFSSIVLYDPANLTADASDRLASWVDQGGGLLIVLGPGFESAEALMESPIARLLPGKVKRITRRALSDRSTSLVPATNSHPIWSIFERPVEEIPWINYAVFRHWDIEELAAESSVLMKFTNSEQPAVIEQFVNQGRIITFALPYPGSDGQDREKMWSELYQDWPGFALFQGTVRYLAAWNKQQLNYFVDEPVVLENNVSQFPQFYMMYNPIQEDARVESTNENLIYSFTRYPGQYRLRGSRPQGPVVRGFSVNIDRKNISLERVKSDILNKALGKDLYRIAKEQNEVQSSLGEGRYGRDLAPFLLVIFVMMIMAEQTMSSRFYAQPTRTRK